MISQQDQAVQTLHRKATLSYAVVVHDPDVDPVIISVAIRKQGQIITCDLTVPKDSYCPFKLLELVEKYNLPKEMIEENSNERCDF
jgi:hypothetical protein